MYMKMKWKCLENMKMKIVVGEIYFFHHHQLHASLFHLNHYSSFFLAFSFIFQHTPSPQNAHCFSPFSFFFMFIILLILASRKMRKWVSTDTYTHSKPPSGSASALKDLFPPCVIRSRSIVSFSLCYKDSMETVGMADTLIDTQG